MTGEVSTTARRIARRHNQMGAGMGGVLVFTADGCGGEWYPAESYGFGADMVVYPVGWRPVTAQQVQDWLDHRFCVRWQTHTPGKDRW